MSRAMPPKRHRSLGFSTRPAARAAAHRALPGRRPSTRSRGTRHGTRGFIESPLRAGALPHGVPRTCAPSSRFWRVLLFRVRIAATTKRPGAGALISGPGDRGGRSGIGNGDRGSARGKRPGAPRPGGARRHRGQGAGAGGGRHGSRFVSLRRHEAAVDRARPNRLAVPDVPARRSLRPFAGSPRPAL